MKLFFKILLIMFLMVAIIPLTIVSILLIAKFYAFMFTVGILLIPLAIPILLTAIVYYWLYKLIASSEKKVA